MPDKDIPQTGPEAILYALQNMTVEDIEERAKEALKTGKKTKRNGAVQLLNIAKGMRRNNLKPEDYMISAVPVIPPQYRPIAAQGDSIIPGDANVLYKDLIDIRDAYNEERELLGDKYSGQSRRALYDAIKSVYGYGEAVKPKTRSKDVQGFLKKITGRTAKTGWMASKMLAKPMDNVGRSTITVDPELSIDQISIPKDMAYKMYAPYIQRQLKHIGMSDAEALQNVRDRSPMADRALSLVMEKRPVLYSRAPAWYSFSFLAGSPTVHDGDDIKINPYVTTGLGADFDGDQQVSSCLFKFKNASLLEGYDIYDKFLKKNALLNAQLVINYLHMNEYATKLKVKQDDVVAIIDLEDLPHGEKTGETKRDGYDIEFFAAIPGTQVLAYAGNGELTWADVSHWSIHKNKEVEIVHLIDGSEIITDDDPRAVFGIPQDAETLVPQRFTPSEAAKRNVMVPKFNGNHDSYTTPEDMWVDIHTGELSYTEQPGMLKLDFNLGQLVGMIAGDGWCSKTDYNNHRRVFYLSDSKEFNAKFIEQYMRDNFGDNFSYYKSWRENIIHGRTAKTWLHEFSGKMGDVMARWLLDCVDGHRNEVSTGAINKKFPSWALSAPKEFRIGLLNGMVTTDGNISAGQKTLADGTKTRSLCIQCSSTSLRLMRDVRSVAKSLGVQGTLRFKPNKEYNDRWEVNFSVADAKKYDIFSRICRPDKRETFVNTPVSFKADHRRFDHVPYPVCVSRLIDAWIKTPATDAKRDYLLTPEAVEWRNYLSNKMSHVREYRTVGYMPRTYAEDVCEMLQRSIDKENTDAQKAHAVLDAILAGTVEDVKEVSQVVLNGIDLAFGRRGKSAEMQEANKTTKAAWRAAAKKNRVHPNLINRLKAIIPTESPTGMSVRGNEIFAAWLELITGDVTWLRIDNIEKTGKVETGYDLTVPGYETFMNSDGVILSNTINVHVPSSDEAVKEAYEKLMPSKTPFSDRVEDKVVPLQKQEQILGLYTAATAPATKPVVFDTEEQAIRAIRRGEVPLSADVQIRSGVKMASADKNLSEVIPPAEKGPVRNPSTGKFMPTSRDNSVTETPAVTEETTKKGE